ncbi:MAG: TerC family protein [Chitinophagales bacterium]|nr:TerC family protein [Chitinophagaceae bacterium]MBP9883775.1 TerC family protein [Chitinophagales bacterium]
MFDFLLTADGLVSLFTLLLMEIILGIDNIIFISLIADRLPKSQQQRGRAIGLALALIVRILLLFSISWLTHLTEPLLTISTFAISARDVILIAGGLFLLYKTTKEIHQKIEGEEHSQQVKGKNTFSSVITQIIIIDVVFSVDSILTAVGLVEDVTIMVIAVTAAMGFMLLFSKWVSEFINNHPTIKMLALSFLLMIGVLLVADGLHYHIEKQYLYFAMAFSFLVEFLNMRERKKRKATN